MSQVTLPVTIAPARAGGVVFAPGEKFFVRRVTLVPDGDPAAQVALALEGLSPFPAAQLYYGFRTNAACDEALVFAAYRKNFTPEEIATWVGAAAVLPDFAIWLGAGTATAAGLSVREDGERVEVIAWDGSSVLPAVVLVRPKGAGERDALVAEASGKAGLAADAPVKIFRPALEITREKRDLILRLSSGGIEAHFDETTLGRADIRDKAVLSERRLMEKRDTLLWRGFAVILGGLAACVLLELGELATRLWLGAQQSEINGQAPIVKKIEEAQSMSKRLEEISTQRLLPFEMLAELQQKRPTSLEYGSITTKGPWQLDVRGQGANAADLTNFESDVRHLDAIEKVEVLEKNTREGVTVFRYEITFKPGWHKAAGGGS